MLIEARRHCCVLDLKYRYSVEAVRVVSVMKDFAGIFEVLAYGLRAGFVCANGTMTGSVVEVVCEGDSCTDSPLGQWMICACQVL